MQKDRFFILFARKLSGDASSEELSELENLLTLYAEFQFFYDELMKPAPQKKAYAALAEQSYTADVMSMQLKGLWSKTTSFQEAAKQHKRPVKKIYRMAVAAVLFFVVGIIGLKIYEDKPPVRLSNNETSTTKGSKSTVKLPDGTVVMLNANSSLKYDEGFTAKKREVFLVGEAYFDVAHDPRHPFIIHTSAADIKVLGTTFNVKSLKDEYFETALITGKVSIYLKHRTEANIVLNPGQKIVVRNKVEESSTLNKKPQVVIDSITVVDGLIAETSWTKNQLVFVDKPLFEIAKELEKKFDVKIIFKSNKFKQRRYSGSYSDTDLNQILDIINMSNPIKYHREKDTIFIQ